MVTHCEIFRLGAVCKQLFPVEERQNHRHIADEHTEHIDTVSVKEETVYSSPSSVVMLTTVPSSGRSRKPAAMKAASIQ